MVYAEVLLASWVIPNIICFSCLQMISKTRFDKNHFTMYHKAIPKLRGR